MTPSLQVDDIELQSGILVPPGEKPLSAAIAQTLRMPPLERAATFERLVRDIQILVAATAPQQPWTCTVYRGTDGSHIFRGGVGHSLVIDPQGRLWRARSYEDFATTYDITPTTCVIATLTPLYDQMREYDRDLTSSALGADDACVPQDAKFADL